MKRAVALLVVLMAAGCSDRHSPTAVTTPTRTDAGAPLPANGNVLRGTVTDVGGLPLAGATVEWIGAAELWGDRGHGVATNQNGEYRFVFGAGLPPGGYAVARATKPGYDQQTKSVQVSGDTLLNFAIARFSANGSITWVSATRARPLCQEIVSQVGKTFPLWLTMKSEGASVTVTLSRDEPPTGDPWSGATTFTGTRNNDEITASYQAPGVPFACSTDTSFTYGEAGELKALVSGSRISGQYTVTYGAGDSQATYVFQFQASL